MAVPITLLVLGAATGAYFLLQPKKQQQANAPAGQPVLVPASALPTPEGGVPPEEMPGGPPTVVVTPPAATPQQLITQALPQLLNQGAAAATKVVAQPGQAASTPGIAMTAPNPAGPVQVPPQVLDQLPTAVTSVLTQAAQAMPPTTPLQSTETAANQDPDGTVALAKMLIDRESTSGWKTALKDAVKAWQTKRGLKADGLYGEKSALEMAKEVGILPLIRYWPSGSTKGTEVPKFRNDLLSFATTVATSNPAHAAALRSSAAYEAGQGYSSNPSGVAVSFRAGQADLLNQVLKQ